MFCLQIVDFQHNLDFYVEQAATALKLFSQSQSDVHYSQTDIQRINEILTSTDRIKREKEREREEKRGYGEEKEKYMFTIEREREER